MPVAAARGLLSWRDTETGAVRAGKRLPIGIVDGDRMRDAAARATIVRWFLNFARAAVCRAWYN